MRKLPDLLVAMALAGFVIAGCDEHGVVAPQQQKTMYALKKGVAFHAGTTAVVKSLQYGESVHVYGCDNLTCFSKVGDTVATVLVGELAEQRPPMGSRYVWGHFGYLQPNQQVTIQAYNPGTHSMQVDGDTWVEHTFLRERPETASETRLREKAEAIAKAKQEKEERIAKAEREREERITKAAQAKQQREEARQEQERSRAAAIETEGDRRAFARQLRDHYLASGADIKVSVSGAHAQRLSLEYPLINDVWLYQFEHSGDVIDALKAKGFTQLDLSDGWSYAKRLTFN